MVTTGRILNLHRRVVLHRGYFVNVRDLFDEQIVERYMLNEQRPWTSSVTH